ncbi:MAG: hypothetical protein K8S20_02605 [Chloroflexi bacterium]|nr:hypothetical protein [Chloroflexota bacterium]
MIDRVVVVCPHCNTKVLPKLNGTCPSCLLFINKELKNVDENEKSTYVRNIPEHSDVNKQSPNIEVGQEINLESNSKELVKFTPNGIPILTDPVEQAKRALAAKKGLRNMLIGLLMLVPGGIFTAIGYLIAPVGGSYVVCYGAIIFGSIKFIQGLVEWLSNREESANVSDKLFPE